ncbi:MAG: 50S ribosomal protein L1 [Brevinematales bacterium]|nr:50S ribosomal protein L1 [Brevinematales bacterium]
MKVLVKNNVVYKGGKRYISIIEKIDVEKEYSLEEACKLVKEAATAKFDETIELAYKLNIKQKHNVRDVVILPHSTGKQCRVLVFAEGEKAQEAQSAGADYVGSVDLVEKIAGGWLEFEACIATPDMMKNLSKVAPILGRRKLMPNPKTGTVTLEIERAVKEAKAGKVEIRNDKTGNVHTIIGKKSFDPKILYENALAIHKVLLKNKPSDLKGEYIATMALSPTMGPAIKVDFKKLSV